MKLTTEYLKECFDYSEESPSGLIWKKRPINHFSSQKGCNIFNGKFARKRAGNINNDTKGYQTWKVEIQTKCFQVHRIIYQLLSDIDPEEYFIDHIDGNSLNNICANLRIASHSDNCCNQKIVKRNTSGFKGVSKKGNGWSARIMVKGKSKWLGKFACPKDAHAAYAKASSEYHGEFGRLA